MTKKQSLPEEKTYLGQLKFDSGLFKSLPGRYLSNVRLMILFLLMAVVIGVGGYFSLPRTLYPEIKIPLIIVSTILPGAGPADVESLVTIPLEREIKRIKGINTYSSTSQQNVSVITVEFTSDVKVDAALDEVQKAVDGVTDLPTDAQDPQVTDLDFENIPVRTFALTKKNNTDLASLNRLAERLKNAVEDLSLVDRAEISGLDQREIQVLIKPELMHERKIDPLSLSQAIKNALSSYPAGTIYTDNSGYALTIDQPANSVSDLREIPVEFDDQKYTLSELAEVSEYSVPNQALSYLASGDVEPTQTVIFTVYKTQAARIDEADAQLQSTLDEVMIDHPEYEIKPITNFADLIDRQFGDLTDNFYQTLLLVFASMLLIYGLRQALIAAVAIPFSLLLVFASMVATDFTLNFLTIFSLLIALGLFVDNAVVIIQAYTTYHKSGKFSPLEAAILVWKDFFVELFTINLLTVWAFLPLLITGGIIGEFIKPLPIIVSAAMMGSVVVAFLFTLPSMMLLTRPQLPKRVKVFLSIVGLLALIGIAIVLIPRSVLFVPTVVVFALFGIVVYVLRQELSSQFSGFYQTQPFAKRVGAFLTRSLDHGFVSLDPVTQWYRGIVTKILNSPRARKQTIVAIIIFTIASYLLVPLGFVVNEFFPKADQETLNIQLEMPPGTNANTTTETALPILNELRQIPEASFVTLQVQSTSGFSFGGSGAGSEQASLTVVFPPKAERNRSSIEIAQELRTKFSTYQQGKLRVIEESGGPPAGEDLEIQVFGDSLEQLGVYATEVEHYLSQLEGTTNINRSIKEGQSKIVFVPDPHKLQQYGLTEGQISTWLRTLASGFTLDDINFNNQERDIVLRMLNESPTPTDIGTIQIPLPGNNRSPSAVSLSELGTLQLKPAPSIITRENGKRSIRITASALPGYLPTQLYQHVQTYMDNDLSLASGYSWRVGGVNEENEKSMQSIINAMGISAMLILITMVTLLGSFRKAVIVMLVIPLSVSGVFIWFALTATPLSFPAMVGLLSLFGIVIANSLMIVDKVNQNLKANFHLKEAIIDASASRLEPIALTSISQIIGLIPITLADPLWRGMGGAIIAGLSFSGTIMLFFIPAVYYWWFKDEDEKQVA
jgi:multidrug efflux pump subunit AcrB